jgi:phospholipid/cholesterol/gamma-HCH transport system substrate-binding protein
METRASHLLVGGFVLVVTAALALFALWLAGADRERDVVGYDIAFTGSVSGLQTGSQVRYRGVPVGRVTDIRIDPEDLEQILVTTEIRADTPIKADTVAALEMQGVTGVVNVQLTGGTREAPDLERRPGEPRPRIASRPSPLEQVFEFTPELLNNAVSVLDRALVLLSDENIEALGATAHSLEAITGAVAGQSDAIDGLLVDSAGAAGDIRRVASELEGLLGELRRTVVRIEEGFDGLNDGLDGSIPDIRLAASSMASAAQRLDALLAATGEPVGDFAGAGLYELSQMVAEARLLIASLTRISREFERDPAGFLLGDQRGFRP